AQSVRQSVLGLSSVPDHSLCILTIPMGSNFTPEILQSVLRDPGLQIDGNDASFLIRSSNSNGLRAPNLASDPRRISSSKSLPRSSTNEYAR
ncbi:MAG: hypothetical protein ACK4S0_13315, partial [Sediminibacterium sp.]